MMQGSTLRVMDAEPFRIVYTLDNWATKSEVDAAAIGRLEHLSISRLLRRLLLLRTATPRRLSSHFPLAGFRTLARP